MLRQIYIYIYIYIYSKYKWAIFHKMNSQFTTFSDYKSYLYAQIHGYIYICIYIYICTSLNRSSTSRPDWRLFHGHRASIWRNWDPNEGLPKPLDTMLPWCTRGFQGTLNEVPMVLVSRAGARRIGAKIAESRLRGDIKNDSAHHLTH